MIIGLIVIEGIRKEPAIISFLRITHSGLFFKSTLFHIVISYI